MSQTVDLRDLAAIFITNALVALGEIPDPNATHKGQDLDQARMSIAFLELIEERTRAARSEEEEQILLRALTQLRLAYVRARDAASTQSRSTSENQTA